MLGGERVHKRGFIRDVCGEIVNLQAAAFHVCLADLSDSVDNVMMLMKW